MINKRLDSLKNVFELFHQKQFIVPNYQRGYSWETKQRKDLLDDIENIKRLNYNHFMGTIVATKKNDNDSRYELVDGQQRIISIFLLLHEFFKLTLQTQFQIDNEWKNNLMNKLPQKRFIILNSETDHFFYQYILDNNFASNPLNKSQNNLKDAKEEFGEWWELKENPHEYIRIILSRLGFLFYSPNYSKEIGIMFEVINNRGKPLSELEKVKNYLTYYSNVNGFEGLSYKVGQVWPTLLQNLSEAGLIDNEDENSFLRYCWLTFYSVNKAKSYHVYDFKKEDFPVERSTEKDCETLLNFVKMMGMSAEFIKQFFTSKEEIFEKLKYQPSHASVMPLYISICFACGSNNTKQKNRMLNLIEKLNFRVYVCPDVTKRSDTYQGDLFSYANRLFKTEYSDNSIEEEEPLTIDQLEKELVEFINTKCPFDDFIKSLTLDFDEDYNYYKWQGLHYFLANYEICLHEHETKCLHDFYKSSTKADDKFVKEHLWATKNRLDDNDRKKDIHEKKRLGNFALLESGINKSGQNKDLDVKLLDKYLLHGDKLRCSNLKMIMQLPQILTTAETFAYDKIPGGKYKNWYYFFYQKIIDQRETEFIRFALNRWGLEKEKKFKVIIDSEKAILDNSNEVYRIKKNS